MKHTFVKIFALAAVITSNLLFLNMGTLTVTNLPSTGSIDLPLEIFSSSAGFTLSTTTPKTWGYYQPNGFVEYTVNVPAAAVYKLEITYASPNSKAGMNSYMNGTYVETVALPTTGSWATYAQAAQTTLSLPVGQSQIRISGWDNSEAFNIQSIRLIATAVAAAVTPTPYSSTVTNLPTSGSVDVLMESFSSSAGFTLSDTAPRTWGYYQPNGYVEYTVNASTAASFSLEITYSTVNPAATTGMNSYLNGKYVESKSLPSTGSWSTYAQSLSTSLSIPSGQSIIRISGWDNSAAFNIRGIRLTAAAGAIASPAATAGYPFDGQKLFVDSNSQSAKMDVNSCAAYSSAPNLTQKINQSAAAWYGDWNSDVGAAVSAQVNSAKNAGAMPVMVLYNIPIRDCGNYSAGGATESTYPTWIDNVAKAIGNAKTAVILEPDALADFTKANCLSDSQKNTRLQLIKGAIASLKKNAPNTAVYIDAGNPTWVPAGTMADLLNSAGVATADGFSLNISNFITTDSNVSYGKQISGLINGKHFIVDTSRNGNGPTADSQWCNPMGRALGQSPQSFSSGLVDAYLWIKKPGESDGTCNGGPTAGQFWLEYACGLAARSPY